MAAEEMHTRCMHHAADQRPKRTHYEPRTLSILANPVLGIPEDLAKTI